MMANSFKHLKLVCVPRKTYGAWKGIRTLLGISRVLLDDPPHAPFFSLMLGLPPIIPFLFLSPPESTLIIEVQIKSLAAIRGLVEKS